MWEGVATLKRCDSPSGSVKVVRNWFQLREKCNAHRKNV